MPVVDVLISQGIVTRRTTETKTEASSSNISTANAAAPHQYACASTQLVEAPRVHHSDARQLTAQRSRCLVASSAPSRSATASLGRASSEKRTPGRLAVMGETRHDAARQSVEQNLALLTICFFLWLCTPDHSDAQTLVGSAGRTWRRRLTGDGGVVAIK